jgi:hypothetical protein
MEFSYSSLPCSAPSKLGLCTLRTWHFVISFFLLQRVHQNRRLRLRSGSGAFLMPGKKRLQFRADHHRIVAVDGLRYSGLNMNLDNWRTFQKRERVLVALNRGS